MGIDHLHGAEPWFWVSAERTVHIRIAACTDGYVVGENAANARLIAAAPELLEALQAMRAAFWGTSHNDDEDKANALAVAAIASATGEQP